MFSRARSSRSAWASKCGHTVGAHRGVYVWGVRVRRCWPRSRPRLVASTGQRVARAVSCSYTATARVPVVHDAMVVLYGIRNGHTYTYKDSSSIRTKIGNNYKGFKTFSFKVEKGFKKHPLTWIHFEKSQTLRFSRYIQKKKWYVLLYVQPFTCQYEL